MPLLQNTNDVCGSKLQYLSTITSPIQCRRIVAHLKMEQNIPVETPIRGSPIEEFKRIKFDDFDQSTS
ncbi:MAG: hypothetical protein ACI9QD_000134 [Thermoproteota archaeon]|jgi:hypothetical protein